ncbi:hypothetical protein Gotur_005083 [Gossypium turneri]
MLPTRSLVFRWQKNHMKISKLGVLKHRASTQARHHSVRFFTVLYGLSGETGMIECIKKGSKSRKEIGRFVNSYISELNEIDKIDHKFP